MNNKNLLIGAGVLVVGYLLWKKSQSNTINKSDIVVPENALVRLKQMECDRRYSELMQPSVMMPQEYWNKRKEDWMKINCK